MNLKISFVKLLVTILLIFCLSEAYAQEHKVFKHFDKKTMNNIKIDYDKDGDLDFIYVGVIADRNQGRVYLIENKGDKFAKPEYIYSYPTISIKQYIEIEHKDNLITINLVGTSPKNVITKFAATIDNGKFQGLLVPPVTSKPCSNPATKTLPLLSSIRI